MWGSLRSGAWHHVEGSFYTLLSCQWFPLVTKIGVGVKGEEAIRVLWAGEKIHYQSNSFIIGLCFYGRGKGPEKGHCYWGYKSSARQDGHKAAAARGRVWMDLGQMRVWPSLCIGLVLRNSVTVVRSNLFWYSGPFILWNIGFII